MQPPERLAVPTCIGCGAMSQFGTCDTGRSERKLELVRAAAYDAPRRRDGNPVRLLDEIAVSSPLEHRTGD